MMIMPSDQGKLLHADANRKTLEFCVRLFFAIWFFRYIFDPLQILGQLPLAYADPVGPLRWLPNWLVESMFGTVGLTLLRFGILSACICVWIKPVRAQSALIGCLFITAAAAICRSFGHINHAEIGPILVTWVLTLFYLKLPAEIPANKKLENSTASTGMITATLVLTLVYALVGIARLCDGGWVIFTGDTIPNHVSQGSYSNWVLPFDFSHWVWDYPAIAWSVKIGTLIVTVLEIATPFALISRRIRYAVLFIMPLFHLGAILMFKVVFIEQPIALILLINLTPIVNRNSESMPVWGFWKKWHFAKQTPA